MSLRRALEGYAAAGQGLNERRVRAALAGAGGGARREGPGKARPGASRLPTEEAP